MANISLTRVNQKLSQARYLLRSASEESLTPIATNSLLEAVAFHLVCAYQHYLREIAETYGLKNAIGLRTEADLIKAFESAKKYPAEAGELAGLRAEPGSWLSQLQRYYDSLWQMPVIASQSSEDNLISLVDVDSLQNQPPVTLALAAHWHKAFVALVQRQRDTSAEF